MDESNSGLGRHAAMDVGGDGSARTNVAEDYRGRTRPERGGHPGVSVESTNSATGVVKATQTDEEGLYAFRVLSVGLGLRAAEFVN